MMKREPVLAILKGTDTDNCNAECIKVLREWLDMAERGEIVAVAIAGLVPCGNAFTEASRTNRQINLLGAVSVLDHKMRARALESD